VVEKKKWAMVGHDGADIKAYIVEAAWILRGKPTIQK